MIDKNETLKRFYKFVNKTETCHLWTGALTASGYGSFWYKTKNWAASRIIWELTYGVIPKDKFVLHKCDIRNCVNLEHLFVGTASDNTLDMWKKKRHKGYGKIDTKQRTEILKKWNSGIPQNQLAKEFNISPQAIWYLIHLPETREKYGKKNGTDKKTNIKIRQDIIKLYKEGFQQSKIAELYKLSKSSVNYIILKHKKEGI